MKGAETIRKSANPIADTSAPRGGPCSGDRVSTATSSQTRPVEFAAPGAAFSPSPAPGRPTMLRSIAFLLVLVAFAPTLPAEAEGPVDERPVRSTELFLPDTGRVAISAQGDRIAFERYDADGYYHLYTARIDGTGSRCLTCTARELRKKNALSPVWHPSGEYLVFQLQSSAKKLGLTAVDLLGGHRGLRSELFYIMESGKGYFQLTNTNETGNTVLAPVFSWEGDRLAWSERVRSRVGRWGTWALRTAELRVKRGVPRLGDVITHEPGKQKLFPRTEQLHA